MKQVKVHDTTLSFGCDRRQVDGTLTKGYRWGPRNPDLFALLPEVSNACMFIPTRTNPSTTGGPTEDAYHNLLCRSGYFFDYSISLYKTMLIEGVTSEGC